MNVKMGHTKSFSTSAEAYDFDEACFRMIYKPLSNLPTPPPSSRSSSFAQSPNVLAEDDPLNSELLAPTIHLARMIPPGLSRHEPSFAIIQTMLSSANLQMDVIALAACILDALPSKFRHSWRTSYPRSHQTSPVSKRHTLPSTPITSPAIEPILPEVAVLAALVIADKFAEDSQEPMSYYARVWGQDLWSCEQVNITERVIMEALEYRILPLWSSQYIKQARHDIELVRRQLHDENSEAYLEAREYECEIQNANCVSSGGAGVGLGLRLTPADTPNSETFEETDIGQETREAFGRAKIIPQDYLHLPAEAASPS